MDRGGFYAGQLSCDDFPDRFSDIRAKAFTWDRSANQPARFLQRMRLHVSVIIIFAGEIYDKILPTTLSAALKLHRWHLLTIFTTVSACVAEANWMV